MRFRYFELVTLLVLFAFINLPNRAVFGCNYGFTNSSGRCVACGTTKVQPNVKIVGGIDARKGSWPAQAYLLISNYNPETQATESGGCGGTLIGPDTVLTAAHCFEDYKPSNAFPTIESTVVIALGAYDVSFIENANPPPKPAEVIVTGALEVKIHEGYIPAYYLHDIALIKLKVKVKPSYYINYACLPKPSRTFPSQGRSVYVAGWGTLFSGGPTPMILKNMYFKVYDPIKYCKNVKIDFPKLWPGQICAGNYAGGQDTCQGDSGGGLMIREKINGVYKYVVAGVVSYGDGCALYHKPGIYTRTSYYIDWILKNI